MTSCVTGFMAGYIVRYLGVVGGAAAGLQVVRGAARGVARLVEGEPHAALGEVVGGLLAPVASVINQATLLGAEVCGAALVIAGGAEPAPALAPAHRRAGC